MDRECFSTICITIIKKKGSSSGGGGGSSSGSGGRDSSVGNRSRFVSRGRPFINGRFIRSIPPAC